MNRVVDPSRRYRSSVVPAELLHRASRRPLASRSRAPSPLRIDEKRSRRTVVRYVAERTTCMNAEHINDAMGVSANSLRALRCTSDKRVRPDFWAERTRRGFPQTCSLFLRHPPPGLTSSRWFRRPHCWHLSRRRMSSSSTSHPRHPPDCEPFDRTGTVWSQCGAGWSSPVARRAHNPKVGGSNPPPATRRVDRPSPTGPLAPAGLGSGRHADAYQATERRTGHHPRPQRSHDPERRVWRDPNGLETAP